MLFFNTFGCPTFQLSIPHASEGFQKIPRSPTKNVICRSQWTFERGRISKMPYINIQMMRCSTDIYIYMLYIYIYIYIYTCLYSLCGCCLSAREKSCSWSRKTMMTSFTRLSKIRTGVLPTMERMESLILVISHHFVGFHDDQQRFALLVHQPLQQHSVVIALHISIWRGSSRVGQVPHRNIGAAHLSVPSWSEHWQGHQRISSISDSTTSEQNFLKFVEILFYSFFWVFFLKAFCHGTDSLPTTLCGPVFMLSARGRKQWSEA